MAERPGFGGEPVAAIGNEAVSRAADPIAFDPNLAFGHLDLIGLDGGLDIEIPSPLVDRPDVLAALVAIAARGGTAWLRRLPDFDTVFVDPDGAVSHRRVDEW